MSQRIIKVMLGMVGLECHERGLLLVAEQLKDAGMEVVYAGKHLVPDAVIKIAMEEQVDAIGLSFLSPEWEYYIPIIVKSLESNLPELTLIVGGGLSPADAARLKSMGVKGVFGPGSTGDEVVKFLCESVAEKSKGDGTG